MSEINYLSEVRPNPGNDGEKPQTCSICGALLVCLSCGNHRDEAMDHARARIAELEQALRGIQRITSPGARTLDDFMRDMGYANDRAHASLKPADPPTEGS